MDYLQRYHQWLNDTAVDDETKEELLALQGNDEDLKDRFYQELAFGTAGLRGKLGAGSNRMNSYIVARATHAFAKVISSYGEEFKQRGVAICQNCRMYLCRTQYSCVSLRKFKKYTSTFFYRKTSPLCRRNQYHCQPQSERLQRI